ncbi:MAG: hypothetical protein L3J50_10310 [Emcibacter sp.]|nr:hypothetical protein [Emcibacter sp.]
MKEIEMLEANSTAYVYKTEASKRLGDIIGMKTDFEFIANSAEHAMRLMKLPENPHRERSLVIAALHDAILIRYRRCFKNGVRELVPTEIFEDIASYYIQLHDYLMDMSDKHVAHSVNEFEQNKVILVVSDKKENYGAIVKQIVMAARGSLLSLETCQQIVKLCNIIVSEYLDKVSLRIDADMDAEVAVLTNEQIRKFSVYNIEMNVGNIRKRRK